MEYYYKAVELGPQNVPAHNNLGNALNELGRFGEAINLNLDYPEVHFNLARTLIKIKKYRKGIQHYLKVKTLRPDFVDAYIELAMAFHSRVFKKKAWPLYHLVGLLRNENGIEKVYLEHLKLSLAQTKPNQMQTSGNKSVLDKIQDFYVPTYQ